LTAGIAARGDDHVNEAVLCVDDEPSVLAAYRLFLQPHFSVHIANGGEEALAVMATLGPFAVVVSDLHMPRMDGIKFLATASKRHPDTVRLLLTGNADLDGAIQAVNDGHIFRFLTKPCLATALATAVRAGVEQYRLITAQKDLLESTLRACVQVLGEVLALVNPVAFGKSLRVRQLVRELAGIAGIAEDWRVDVAAMLSQLGCVVVPDAIISKADRGAELNEMELQTLARHPHIGYELLRSIPRLERVAEIVAYQNHSREASGEGSGVDLPPGAGLLKVALDFDALRQKGELETVALAIMRSQEEWYDPVALNALEAFVRQYVPVQSREIPLEQLGIGMVVASDVCGPTGVLLLKAGVQVSEMMKLRLQTMGAHGGVAGPISVFITE
jgi:response regulator RpfG family c-di-GMP phosphodiesterase